MKLVILSFMTRQKYITKRLPLCSNQHLRAKKLNFLCLVYVLKYFKTQNVRLHIFTFKFKNLTDMILKILTKKS